MNRRGRDYSDSVMGNLDISYRPLCKLSAEQARRIRAQVLLYAFQCYEAKKYPAADPSVRGVKDGTKVKGDSASYGHNISD